MAIGPCLCGDPYCGSCGNPGLAQFEDWLDKHCEKLTELKIDKAEAAYLDKIIPILIEENRAAVKQALIDMGGQS